MPTAFLTPLRPVRWCVLMLAACASQPGFGYQPPGFQRGPSCDTLPPAPCAPPACQPAYPPRCQSCCTCQDCREQPRSVPDQPRDAAIPRPAAPPSELRETGFYQAGPRSGALEGGHSTFGFRGGALTLPKVRLELPSIELPSFFRTSYAAKMRVAESEAPWTSTGFQRVTYAEDVAQGRGAAPQTDARDAAEPRATAPADAADLKAQYEAKLEELCKKIEACERMRQQLEQSLHCPPPPPCVPAVPPCIPGHSGVPGAHCAPAPGQAWAPLPHAASPPSLTTTTGPTVPWPPQARAPEEIRALPAEPAGGSLPAPQPPPPNPFDAPPATSPAAARPWQPLPIGKATEGLAPGAAHTANTAVANRPPAHAKPQRLPSR